MEQMSDFFVEHRYFKFQDEICTCGVPEVL